ncbi:hypothetical protein Tco_1337873 [Tanacetum coccineum]
MDESNLTMEEYIELEAEKAHRRSQTFNWKIAMYGKVRYHENIDYFRDFETDFPAIIYDDALATDMRSHPKPTVRPLDNNEINFRISLDESDDEDYVYIYDKNSVRDFNFGVMEQLPLRSQRHTWIIYEVEEYTDKIVQDFEERLAMIFGQVVFTSHAWRRLFEVRGPLVRGLMLEFFSTCGFANTVLELEDASTFSFQLGGARRQMSWRQFILSMGFHTVEEIAADDFRVYSAESSKTIAFKGDLSGYWDEISSSGDFLTKVPSYIQIRGPLRRLCHRMIAHTITRRGREPRKGTTVVVRELTEIDLDELSRLHICERVGDTWAWVAPGPERQQDVAATSGEVDPDVAEKGAWLFQHPLRLLLQLLGPSHRGLNMAYLSTSWTSSDKTDDEKMKTDEDSNARDDQAGKYNVLVHGKEQEQPIFKPHSPTLTVSCQEDVSGYLNENPENVLTDIMSGPAYTETHTTSLVPIQEGNSEVQDVPPTDTVMSSPPTITTHIPITKSQQKRANHLLQKARRKKNDSTKAIMNNQEPISDVVPKSVFDFVQPRLESNVMDVMKTNPTDMFKSSSTSSNNLTEYELKHKLYNMMFIRKSFNTHEHHNYLYNTLMNSMVIDELVSRGKISLMPTLKKRSYDDQDPPKNHEGEKRKRRRKNTGGSSSKKDKAPVDSSNYERFAHADEPQQQEQEVPIEFNELVDANNDPREFELQEGSTIMFAKKMKRFLKKDKITRADLEGPTFELLKNRFKKNVELEYNLEQCYLAMTNKIDWANPIGNTFHNDLSKPLPLEGPPGRKTIPTRYFFNKDLEYLKHGNIDKKYALSLSKVKAARYEQEGIEEMIPYLWRSSIHKYNTDAEFSIHQWRENFQWFYKGNIGRTSAHDVYSRIKIISVQRISVDRRYVYGYLNEIVVKRVDQKKYTFMVFDFLRLNLNDNEDLYLLKILDKIHNLDGVDEYDLINALLLHIRRIVIKKRVEDA